MLVAAGISVMLLPEESEGGDARGCRANVGKLPLKICGQLGRVARGLDGEMYPSAMARGIRK